MRSTKVLAATVCSSALITLFAWSTQALDSRKAPPVAIGPDFATASASPAAFPLERRVWEGDLETKARAVLAAQAEALGWSAPAELELKSIRRGKAVDVVRFRHVVDGLVVLRSEVAVSFNKQGHSIFLANDLKAVRGDDVAGFAIIALAPLVTKETARAGALEWLGVTGSLQHDAAELAIFPGVDGAKLVWATRLVPKGTPHGDWEILVDATTGELLRKEDLASYGVPNGQAFMPDPLGSAGVQYGGNYVDSNDTDVPELVAEIKLVNLLGLLESGGVWELKGPYTDCEGGLESPIDTCATSTGDADFRLVPSSRESQLFEEMNVYYHIDTYLRYIDQTLGIPGVAPNTVPGPVRFDPHGLSGADNSHFVSSTDIVAFGDGCVDDSEDADVVVHELGHGIHDWITDGGLSQVQGLSEGLGDYFAVSYSRSFFPSQWGPSDPEYNWVFSWDGHNPCWGGRVTNWNDTRLYPTNLTGSIHTDGQFWASCNLDIAEAIGYPETDRAVIEGISMTGSSTSQAQAAAAVMVAAEALGYTAPTLATMAELYNDSSGGFGCNYGVTSPVLFFSGFEEGDTSAWSNTSP